MAAETVVEIEDSESNDKCCRICYESNDPKTMIAPCLCTGDLKFIHRKCLNEYRAFNVMHPSFTQCNTCKFSKNYLISIILQNSILINCKNKTVLIT